MPHRRRPAHDALHPLHVTLRAVPGLPSLRSRSLFAAVRRGLAASGSRPLRVVEFSVQTNHVHLLAEADDARTLSRGVQGLGIRLAKAINRLLGRHGRVWADRYHARALRTPREVRHGLVYVLKNGQKHGVTGGEIDPCSSGAWFSGWRERVPVARGPSPMARARTWLLRVGWRRSGPISIGEAPAPRGRRASGVPRGGGS